MYLEANITIDIENNIDPQTVIEQIQKLLSSVNGNDTDVNIIEVDDPITMSPVHFREEY